MFRLLRLYCHTISYLHWQQVFYRLKYRVLRRAFHMDRTTPFHVETLPVMAEGLRCDNKYTHPNTFDLLHIRREYEEEIDWNDGRQGKLWLYHLCAMEYLNQRELSPEHGRYLIEQIREFSGLKDGMEPWPLSLRLVNVVRFVTRTGLNDPLINQWIKAQFEYLSGHIEWHLMANHVLENLFALCVVSIYLRDEMTASRYGDMLVRQLEEQVLEDGAHYERSPMYHSIILSRVFDLYQLQRFNADFPQPIPIPMLKDIAERMLGWLQQMTLPDGQWAHFNDSTSGIGPSTTELELYASLLGIQGHCGGLGVSGFRRYGSEEGILLLVDAGDVRPSYQPGHAHCSMMSIVLYWEGQPLLVDTAISTYEMGRRRHAERSTQAHNTVQIGDGEQSEIWAGFRMARRAKVLRLDEDANTVMAEILWPGRNKGVHRRKLTTEASVLLVEDRVYGGHAGPRGIAHFHFAPGVQLRIMERGKVDFGCGILTVDGADRIEEFRYEMAEGFNRTTEASGVRIHFREWMACRFDFVKKVNNKIC